MCGRYTHRFTWREIHRLLSLTSMPEGEAQSFNVAPTQFAPIVTRTPQGRGLVMARWGLRPPWLTGGPAPINARAETVATSPMFRSAFARGRCIVPASGFYEWRRLAAGKQPTYIYRADGMPLLLAGLPEPAVDEASPPTFAIITVGANQFLRPVHDRMPAVLEPEQAAAWLAEGDGAECRSLLAPAADGVLAMHPVGRMVNSPKHNTPGLIEPVA